MLLLAVSGCTAASPSTTASSGPSATPHASASASSTPNENTAPAWTATGSMIEARSDQTATLLPDGRVLVTGGHDSSIDVLASAELYDPSSGTWTATGSMAEGRIGHTAALLPDGRVLVAGGYTNDSSGSFATMLASAELYDPSNGTWTATGNMIEARGGHTATLLPDGRLMVAGGSQLASAELYDPGSGTWTPTGNMITPRGGHTATLLRDGRVLVAGGCCSGSLPGPVDSLASVELYDPGSGSWTATGNMITPRGGHPATLLRDGSVLVAGGVRSSGGGMGVEQQPLASAELYDPSSGSWTATGQMIEARQVATLLPDGSVLAVGGCCGLVASAELYDPSTGTWTATVSMIEGRGGATATLLPDGTVLVAGGGNSSGSPVASAELYDPGSGT